LREILLPLPGKDQDYRIFLNLGLRRRMGQVLARLPLANRLAVVSDSRVAGLYGREVVASLENAGYQVMLLTVPPGERSKSWPRVQRLARQLLEYQADRRTPLVALGGGVVGDLTGFLASIFLRGVPFIQIPTTLLAMVDAAIGGKTAINLPEGKNLLGTFHQPRAVLIDPEFLKTLPPAQRRHGLAEVLKAGFIRDPKLLRRLEAVRPRLFQDWSEVAEIIFRAAQIKAQVVVADEREADLRRILNFGHTLGHALEAASQYRLPHGQAVAWGMLAALELSRLLTGLTPEAAAFGRELIRAYGLTRTLPALDSAKVLQALPRDKKRQGDDLVFVLLKELGQPVIYGSVPLELVSRCLQSLLA
jgi:3-dehydroquinate synthase